MTTSLSVLALAVAAGALVLVMLLWLRGRPSAKQTRQSELEATLAEVNARMARLSGDVSDALERARAEGARGRSLGDLVGSIDLRSEEHTSELQSRI